MTNKPRVHVNEDEQCVTTVLPDGSTIAAVPNHTPEDIARAQALGYSNVWQMTRDHDALHCLIADAQGHDYSAALYLAAHPTAQDLRHRATEEERTVLLVQRLLNEGVDAVLEDHGMAV